MKTSKHKIFLAVVFNQTPLSLLSLLFLGGCIMDLGKQEMMPHLQPDSETLQDCEETRQDVVLGEPVLADGFTESDGPEMGEDITLETASSDADAEGGDGDEDEETESIPACGNGISETSEECDDGNSTGGDGCEIDCKFSCHEDSECNDGNVCTDDVCENISSGKKCSNINNSSECDDGDSCTSHDRCFDGVCRSGSPLPVWYRDTDGDGYGSSSDTLCSETQPASYVADSSDCCDTDPDVHPAQPGFFTEHNHCGDFDYNCDGNIEMQVPDVLQCDSDCAHEHEIGPCPGDAVPSCGEEYILCVCLRWPLPSSSNCAPLQSNVDPPATDIQRCR